MRLLKFIHRGESKANLFFNLKLNNTLLLPFRWVVLETVREGREREKRNRKKREKEEGERVKSMLYKVILGILRTTHKPLIVT